MNSFQATAIWFERVGGLRTRPGSETNDVPVASSTQNAGHQKVDSFDGACFTRTPIHRWYGREKHDKPL